MARSKRFCLLIGMCFTPALGYLLRLSEGFSRDWDLVALQYIDHLDDSFHVSDEQLDRYAAIVYNPPIWTGWGRSADRYAQLIARFPKHAQQITFPSPAFNLLWPNHALDPRFHTTPGPGSYEDNNKQLYAYSDLHVLEMRRQGKAPQQIVADYAALDLPSHIDLDRLLRFVIEGQRAREAVTDVKVLDHIADRFREKRLFLCLNHGSNVLMVHMADQILHALGYPPLPNYATTSICELTEPEIPVHPSLIGHFGLSYLDKDTRYRLDRRNLTWSEYVYQLSIDMGGGEPIDLSDRRSRVEQWTRSVYQRLDGPDIGWSEIVELSRAYIEACPDVQFPLDIEKRGLEILVASYPDREDLRRRLATVNDLIAQAARGAITDLVGPG